MLQIQNEACISYLPFEHDVCLCSGSCAGFSRLYLRCVQQASLQSARPSGDDRKARIHSANYGWGGWLSSLFRSGVATTSPPWCSSGTLSLDYHQGREDNFRYTKCSWTSPYLLW